MVPEASVSSRPRPNENTRPAGGLVLGRDERAASEIVGALMLILIVVVASTAFASFAQSKQKEIQASQKQQLRMDLERLEVLSPGPTLNPITGSDWEAFDFTVVNAGIHPS